MSSAFARATRSESRDNPSSRLYSLWVCRWTNCLAMTCPTCTARRSAAVRASLGLERLQHHEHEDEPETRKLHPVRSNDDPIRECGLQLGGDLPPSPRVLPR